MSSGPLSLSSRQVGIIFDGDDTHPHNSDPIITLGVVSQYLEAVVAVSKLVHGREIQFEGIGVRDKCTLIETNTKEECQIVDLRTAADTLGDVIDSGVAPPRGLGSIVKELRTRFLDLDERVSVKIETDGWSREIRAPEFVDSSYTYRASFDGPVFVLSSGGRKPKVKFLSDVEGKPFTLGASKKDTETIGKCLYRRGRLVADVIRNEMHQIVTGTVGDFYEISSGGQYEALKDWFKPYSEYWDQFDDIQKALRGEDDIEGGWDDETS